MVTLYLRLGYDALKWNGNQSVPSKLVNKVAVKFISVLKGEIIILLAYKYIQVGK